MNKMDNTITFGTMKRTLVLLALTISSLTYAQVDVKNMNASNTWLKVGPNLALPLSTLAQTTTIGIGIDASLQFLETKANGIGVKAGYIHYLGKDNNEAVGVLPLAIMYRYYPESKGWFAGLELGYSFLSDFTAAENGIFVRPQAGLHFDHWNFFAYYDYISYNEGSDNLSSVGLAATYNIRFK